MWSERLKEWARLRLGSGADGDAASDERICAYEDVQKENIAAEIAGKLAALTVADSPLKVTGPENGRTALIRDALTPLWHRDAARITAQALGKGGKVLVPAVCGGRIRISAIDHNRLLIRETDGQRITSCTLLADVCEEGGVRYSLLTDYILRDGAQLIRARVRSDKGEWLPPRLVSRWADVEPEITVDNTDRLLLAYLRCPRDNRTDDCRLGVPITYGAEPVIAELNEHLATYRREYRLSRAMLGLDATLWRRFGKDRNAPVSIAELRRTVQDSDDPFIPVEGANLSERAVWQHYAPAIRHEAMETRLNSLMRRVEKACGLSQGILTERKAVSYANRDEIRAAQYDTFCTVRAMRDQWEAAMEDLAYAADVLAERFGLSPAGGCGRWRLRFDWDTSLIESASEAFQQRLALHSLGLLDGEALREWVLGSEAPGGSASTEYQKSGGTA